MNNRDFWDRAFLAGLNAGRNVEQAEKQADQALAIWAQRNAPAKTVTSLVESEEDSTPRRRGRPPKKKPEPEPLPSPTRSADPVDLSPDDME